MHKNVHEPCISTQTPCCSIIIPAYNEENSIANVLGAITHEMEGAGFAHEIIVVDDGSSDNTAEIAGAIDNVRVVRHASNTGYGAALKSGIRQAKYDVIVITDADGTYPIDMIPSLVEHMQECDMVAGARVGEHVHIPSLRKFPKWVLRTLANYLTGMHIPDLNSGLRAFKKEIAVKFFHILPAGFSFTTTITLAMLTNDYRVHYVPINYYKRVGSSKIKPVTDTVNFLMLIVRAIMYFEPLKIFLPISASLFLLAFGIFVYSFFWGERLLDTTVSLISMTAAQVLVIGLLADLINKRAQPLDSDQTR